MKPICVLGATGTTGKTISAILDAKNIPLILAARNLEALEQLSNSLANPTINKKIDILDDYSIKETLDGAGLVINCIGPFTKYGRPVIEQALVQKLDYLDITGEQYFIHQVQQNYHLRAQESEISLIPSSAFEFALGDCAIAMLSKEFDQLNSVEITYNFKNIATSRGTNNSVIYALASPAFLKIEGELVAIKPGSFVESVSKEKSNFVKTKSRFGFPGGEVFMAPRHTDVGTIKTYLSSSSNAALMTIGSMLSTSAMKTPLKDRLFHKLMDRTKQAIDESSQAKTFFEIVVLATGRKDGGQECHCLKISGSNPYRLTAAIVISLAEKLIEPENKCPKGVISPSMVAGFETVVKSTELYGTKWQFVKTEAQQ